MSVECFGVTKRYGAKLALDDVSLEISDGGVTGLIGPNGAGKSTLIKIITGLVWPTEGFVLVDGFDAHREHVKAMRRIGAIIEWPSFIEDLSVRHNLDLFSGGRGPAYEKRRMEILKFMELDTQLERKVRSFSTGMRQRLGITLALLPDSEFIILDEPTNGLDPAGIVEIRQIIREYNRRFGVSVLVSSHLLGEVEQLCDRLILIDRGRVRACGSIAELLGDRKRTLVKLDRPEAGREALARAMASGVLPQADMELLPENRLRIALPPEAAPEVDRILIAAGLAVFELTHERVTLEHFFFAETKGKL